MTQNGKNSPDGRMMVSPQLIDALLQILNKISTGESMLPANRLSTTIDLDLIPIAMNQILPGV